jgi:hypothetical protein
MGFGCDDYVVDNWIRIIGWLPVHSTDRVLVISDAVYPKKPALPWDCKVDILPHYYEEIKEEPYDYVIVTNLSSMPFSALKEFLTKIKHYIKRSGQVCLIAPNRLSYRSWNGISIPGEGELLKPRDSENERLPYTRSELLDVIGKNWKYTFYYLAPTIDFITDIWSDKSLPDKTGYSEDSFYYGRDRVLFHHDYDVLGATMDEGLYPELADAYVVLLSVSGMRHNIPERIHYSVRRRDEFQTVTEIRGKRVEKRPFKKVATPHLLHIQSVYSELRQRYHGCSLQWNKIISTDEANTRFEFIKGETLENQLDQLLKEEKIEEICIWIRKYFDCFRSGQSMELYSMTEGFEEVFGSLNEDEIRMLSGMGTLPITDIDCIFGNALIQNKGFEIMDYEWTFRFPIPFEYVEWRCIHYYLNYREDRKAAIGNKLYETFKLDEKKRKLFHKMEKSFQFYVMGNNGTYQQSLEARGSVLNVQNLCEKWQDIVRVSGSSAYFDRGTGFSEGDSIGLQPQELQRGTLCVDLRTDDDVSKLRIDPVAANGLFLLYEVSVNETSMMDDHEGKISFQNMTEITISKQVRAFLTERMDPQIIISVGGQSRVHMEYRYLSLVDAKYDEDPLEILNSGNVAGELPR